MRSIGSARSSASTKMMGVHFAFLRILDPLCGVKKNSPTIDVLIIMNIWVSHQKTSSIVMSGKFPSSKVMVGHPVAAQFSSNANDTEAQNLAIFNNFDRSKPGTSIL